MTDSISRSKHKQLRLVSTSQSDESCIQATSQQSRFHSAKLDAYTTEIDLKTVCITVGEQEVLVDAHLKLQEGVRYGLIGRNGCGKSTLFQALADRLIPGLPPSLRVHLVSQVDESNLGDDSNVTVLQHVLDGHTERRQAVIRRDSVLHKALECESVDETQRILGQLLVDEARDRLQERRLIAMRRSGARGWTAREDEIAAEKVLAEAVQRLELGKIADDSIATATRMLTEAETSLELLDAQASEQQARHILKGLGFKKTMVDRPYAALSGGWRSRCRLATALIVQTDLLLLDEPTNFMDLEAVLWLEQSLPLLSSYSTLLLTSHDQTFLDRVAEQTIYLRNSSLSYFDGPPSLMLSTEAEERLASLKTLSALDKKREHIQSSILAGKKAAKDKGDDNKARMAKSRQKKLDERFGIETSAKGTRFKLNRDLGGYHASRRAEVIIKDEEREVKIKFRDPPEVKVKGTFVHVEGARLGYKEKVVLDGVNMSIQPGDRVSLLGGNGQGKSTLARLLTSNLVPSKGNVSVHPGIRIGYFDQHVVEQLSSNDDQTPVRRFMKYCLESYKETVSESEARRYLGSMGLHGPTAAEVPVGSLSGGQKVRLALALTMYRPPHMLVLDEVTTHLDVQAIRALAKALREWKGALVIITHDRSNVMQEEMADGNDTPAAGTPGRTYLVDKGKVRQLPGGVRDYEVEVVKKVRRRLGS